MNKQQLIHKLEQAWADFQESYAGLSDEQMVASGVTGDWSVKDILAHVSWWEQEAIKHLPTILQGGRPPRYSVMYGGIDAFNAQMTERMHGFSLAEVRQRSEDTHLQLVEYLKSVPDDQFTSDTRFRRRLRLDTYSHYPLHAKAICQWRAQSG